MRKISQSQIKNFIKCSRRYFLENISCIAWPQQEKQNKSLLYGSEFHQLIHRHILGFPKEILMSGARNATADWYQTFIEADPLSGYDVVYPEFELSAELFGVLCHGKFDALAISKDKVTIFDWKTNKKIGKKSEYIKSPQTRLYRLLAKMTVHKMLGCENPVPAEKIEMAYWFPEHPENPIILPYSESEYKNDLAWLRLYIARMTSEKKEDYPQQSDKDVCFECPFCTYCHPEFANEKSEDIDEDTENDLYSIATEEFFETSF